jgi:hypothetical protein
MDKDPTPQQLINLFLFDLCHHNATFDDAPSALSESEIITLKVALLDGWTNIGLFRETATRFSFVGNNGKVQGVHIPDYAIDLNAAFGVFERLKINDFSLTKCRLSEELDTVYVAIYARSPNQQDNIEVTSKISGSIALCGLFITIGEELEPVKGYELLKDLEQVVYIKNKAVKENRFDDAAEHRTREIELRLLIKDNATHPPTSRPTI